jgi:hypothetical protein
MLKINYNGLCKIDLSFHSRVCNSELRICFLQKNIPIQITRHSIIREKLAFGKWRGMNLAITFRPTIDDQNPQGWTKRS